MSPYKNSQKASQVKDGYVSQDLFWICIQNHKYDTFDYK